MREDFLEFLPKNSVGAEIGVLRGGFTKSILQIVQPKKLYLIDGWWTIYGEQYPWQAEDADFKELMTRDAFESTKKIVELYDVNKASEIIVGGDLEILEKFDDHFFDWVYLDTTHEYNHTKLELEILKRKVKDHGLIAGDDWFSDIEHIHHGVYRAVNEFCETHNYKIKKIDDSYQWIIQKK